MAGERVILNVACGHQYPTGQKRMLASLREHRVKAETMVWTGQLPAGSPSHDSSPYEFKLHAMKAAIAQGHTTLLWLDAAAWAVRDLGPLFDRIEREGHYFFHGGASLGQRCSDAALAEFGMSRDDACGIQLVGGTVYGLDLLNPRTRRFYDLWWHFAKAGCFKGPAINDINQAVMMGLAGRPVGHCSDDPRCQGHCHDESCATFVAHSLGMASVGIGDVFAPYSPQNAADPRIFVVSQGL